MALRNTMVKLTTLFSSSNNGGSPQRMGVEPDSDTIMENESVEVSPCWRFTWNIENFSSLKNKKHYSNEFSADGFKWRIMIYPKGNNVDYFSMYIAVADLANLPDGWSRYAEFSLSIVNQIEFRKSFREDFKHTLKESQSSWGFTKFIPLTELKDPDRGFLVKDKLILEAEIVGLNTQGAKADTITYPNCVVEEDEPSLSFKLMHLKKQVFDELPQSPHYAPLAKYSDKVREGMKIGLDIAFVNLSQEIRMLEDPESFWSKQDDFMKQLMELEEMGYNMEKLREHLQSLKEIVERDRTAKEALEKLKTEMQELENKLTTIKAEIGKLKKDSFDALDEFASTTKSLLK